MSDLLHNERLMDFALFVLEHGLGSIEHGGRLLPFTFTESPAGREMTTFVDDGAASVIDRARASLRDVSDIELGAVAYDAYATLEGERYDAVIVEFYERGGAHAGLIAQRYLPGSEAEPLVRVSKPSLLGTPDPLF